MAKFITKETFKSAKVEINLFKEVDTPWGTARIKQLSARESVDFDVEMARKQLRVREKDPTANVYHSLELLARCLCDENGKRVFDDSDEAIRLLGEFPAGALNPLIDAVQIYVPIGNKTVEEDAAKNSETPPSEESTG